jgi:hypothetical protein
VLALPMSLAACMGAMEAPPQHPEPQHMMGAVREDVPPPAPDAGSPVEQDHTPPPQNGPLAPR